jgi:GT2 family glycosyltransferase
MAGANSEISKVNQDFALETGCCSDKPNAPSLEVSILILNWNKSDLTLKCVESVRSHVCGVKYEIIVVDNGSEFGQAESLQTGLNKDVRFISLKQNVFFGEGNNIAADAARGEFLLFLNNDVTVLADCVATLLAEFKNCFSPGAIGPRFLYPNGTLQEAGAYMRPDGWPIRQGEGNVSLDPHFERGCHIVDYCSAACLLVERNTFLRVGGFDPLFDPAYFEDVDLCLRLRSIGLYTYFASSVSVYHDENTTSTELWGAQKIAEIVTANHQRFVRRWGDYLKRRIHEAVCFPKPVPLAAECEPIVGPASAPSVLLSSSSIIQLTDDCLAMMRCARALRGTYKITFAAPEICSHLRIQSLCRHLGFQLDDFEVIRTPKEVNSTYDRVLIFPSATTLPSGSTPIDVLRSIYRSL